MSSDKDDAYRNLITAVTKSRDSVEKFLPHLDSQVNDIIKEKVTDKKEIEFLLDTISSMMYMGLGREQYLNLLEYYKTIDQEGAVFYWGIYEKITE